MREQQVYLSKLQAWSWKRLKRDTLLAYTAIRAAYHSDHPLNTSLNGIIGYTVTKRDSITEIPFDDDKYIQQLLKVSQQSFNI